MKTTIKRTFDAVKFMREQREILGKKLSKMTKEEDCRVFQTEELKQLYKAQCITAHSRQGINYNYLSTLLQFKNLLK